MKTTKNLKRVAMLGLFSVAAIGGYNTLNSVESTDLSKLVTISNANATEPVTPPEGTVKCGDSGSGCKYTIQVGESSETVTSQILKEYSKPKD